MRVVYENEFVVLVFFEESMLIELTWLEGTAIMQENGYKNIFLKIFTIAFELIPQRLIVNLQKMEFVITLDLLNWTYHTIISPLFKTRVYTRMALVVNEEFLLRFSMDKMIDFSKKQPYFFMCFHSKDKAREWLSVYGLLPLPSLEKQAESFHFLANTTKQVLKTKYVEHYFSEAHQCIAITICLLLIKNCHQF